MKFPTTRVHEHGLSESRRGQSETLGFILIFSVILIGALVVVALGGVAIGDTEDGLSNERAEKTMTQFASKGALVALEGSDTQRVKFPTSNRDAYTIDENAGEMKITYEFLNESGELQQETIDEVTLGTMSYEGSDGTTVAYQGGGVWRAGDGGGSSMVSPPEFHYRAATLTLPIVTIQGEDTLSDRAVISQEGTTGIFPDPDDEELSNPLEDGQVNVTVTSRFYQAWGTYFEDRTDGGVTYDHENQEVTVELTVPFEESFNHALATTTGDIEANPGPPPENSEENVGYPSADERIEDLIEDCQENSCGDLTDEEEIDDEGTYFKNGSFDGSFDVDSPGGDVDVVINGDFEPDGVEITGMDDHSVNIYVKGDFTTSGNTDINDVGGNPEDLSTLVHSVGDVSLDGTPRYVGLIYAPESDCTLNGGDGGSGNTVNLEGGMICDDITLNGEDDDIVYDPGIRDADLGLEGEDVSFITFLHISENEISITSN